MGIAIPQVLSEDKASGAQIVDGSLRFDGSKTHYLTRTPAVAGNRRTFTLSFWIKLNSLTGAGGAGHSNLYMGGNGSNDNEFFNPLILAGGAGISVGSYNFGIATTNAYFRDISAWYHIVIAVDTTQSAQIDKLKVYQNGVLLTFTGAVSSSFTTNFDTGVNNTTPQFIGELGTSAGLLRYYPYAQFSQYYLIDGQALDASYFGYTDPLTNTWRPKKLSSSVAFGTNGFYLPFDGSAPIGQDQSGRGNNWTPVNFGGSNTLEKATGALPILNTDGGGKVARVGVRTDSSASSLVLALPLVGTKSDFSNAVNSGTSNKAITANGNAAASSVQSNFYGGSFYFDGNGTTGLTVTYTSDFDCSGTFTSECWVYGTQLGNYNPIICQWSSDGTGTDAWTLETVGTALRLYVTDLTYIEDPVPFVLNRWQHFAVVYNGGTLSLYRDGVLVGSASKTISASTLNYTVGRFHNNETSGQTWYGYIQDVRHYKGLAKYTQNFIPASTDPDILPDTPSGVSYSSNVALVPSTDGAVAFDGSGDFLNVGTSSDYAFGTGDFTMECFVYHNDLTGQQTYFSDAFGNTAGIYFCKREPANGNVLAIYTTTFIVTGSLALSSRRWHHIAVCRSSGTIRLFVDGVLDGSAADSTNLTQTQYSIGESFDGTSGGMNGFISNAHIVKGTALYTSNFTPPTGPISSVANTKLLCCKSQSSAKFSSVVPVSGINDGTIWSDYFISGSPNTIAPNSFQSAFDGLTTGTGYFPQPNTEAIWQPSSSISFTTLKLWTYKDNSPGQLYIKDGTNAFINVTSQIPGHNGVGPQETTITGLTSPLKAIKWVSGSWPQNVVVKAININGTILRDPIIVNGNAAATNFNPFTVNINTQRGQESGWCTWNPLDTAGSTLSNGNLNITTPSSGLGATRGTIGVSSGKWYYEHTITSGATAIGIMKLTDILVSGSGVIGASAGGYSYYSEGVAGGGYTKKINNGTQTDYGASFDPSDTISVAFDLDAGTITFYKNGISQGIAFSGLSGTFSAAISDGTNAGSIVGASNFGQKPFKFPPPAGFQPLALANTPRPTIVRPDQFVGVTTYTGTGAASRPLTNLGFKPDFVWIKNRSSGSYSHQLFDSVRGASAGCLYSDLTNAQDSNFPITSFDTSGFTLGSSASLASQSYASQNGSGSNYVGWAWKAGGNSNTYNINDVGYATASAAELTAGTITPTGASVNTKSGFSIITYTGPNDTSAHSFSHGLGKKPSFILIKNRDRAFNWDIYHSSLGYNSSLIFTTAATRSGAYSAEPDSTLVNVQWNYTTYQNDKYVAYCWAEIPDFSKFGSYTGNGSADGPVVNCNFRPRWLLVKSSSYIDEWRIYDAVRLGYNTVATILTPNDSQAEGTSSYSLDLLSNGFKLRGAGGPINTSGETYIYAAFAESPTFNLYGAQSNAR